MNTPDTECGCTNKKYCTKHFNESVRKDHPELENDTPDTEWEKIIESNCKIERYGSSDKYKYWHVKYSDVIELLSSRDTHWKEREKEVLKSIIRVAKDPDAVDRIASLRLRELLDLDNLK